ncbi:MAG: caspase family protein [Candidatus Obscuribacterales bacterium]
MSEIQGMGVILSENYYRARAFLGRSRCAALLLTLLFLASSAAMAQEKAAGVSNDSSSVDSLAVNRPIRDKWALVVGVSEFANPALNLKYSAKDAKDFADYLVKEADFAPDHVKLLLNKDATERRILSELGDRWLPRVANPDDLVVIFVSTHGSGAELDVGGQNYLVAYDTDVQDLYTTGVPMQRLAKDIKDRVHCDRVVIFLDACHSGGVKSESKGLTRTGVDASELAIGSGRMVIASSAEDQVSWESKSGSNGVFTAALLQSLRKKGKETTVGEMFSDLKEKVQDQVLRERGRLQTPVLESKWKGNDLCIAATPVSRRPGLNVQSTPAAPREATKPIVSGTAVSSTRSSTTAPSPVVADALKSSSPPSSIPITSAASPAYIKPGLLIVPGQSVGRTSIGMSRQAVENLLGKPSSENSGTLVYRTADHKYFLALRLAGDSINEILFSSPAFVTSGGVGLDSFASNRASMKVSDLAGPYKAYETKTAGLSFLVKDGSEVPQFAVVHKGQMTAPELLAASLVDQVTNNSNQAKLSLSQNSNKSANSSTLIVPGQSLAKIKLGISKQQAIALLGRPTDESENVMCYWTSDRRYFLIVRTTEGKVSDVLFDSPAYATAAGIAVTNFKQANSLQAFQPPHRPVNRPVDIYTLKDGGLSFFQPLAWPSPVGWVHDKSAVVNDLDWLTKVRADMFAETVLPFAPNRPRLFNKGNRPMIGPGSGQGPRGRRRVGYNWQ